MAKFPTREADVGAMAGTIISGLTEYAEEFPACPVSVETLREVLNGYNATRDVAAIAQASASEAFGEDELGLGLAQLGDGAAELGVDRGQLGGPQLDLGL